MKTQTESYIHEGDPGHPNSWVRTYDAQGNVVNRIFGDRQSEEQTQ